MCVIYPCIDPVLPGIYWREDSSWQLYDQATTRAIIKAATKGLDSFVLGNFNSAVHPTGATYELDFNRMEQRNVRSGQPRAIKFVPDVSVNELRPVSVLYISPQTWSKVAEAVTQEEYICSAVGLRAGKDALAVSSVSRNPHLSSGSPRLQQFVQSLSPLAATDATAVLAKVFNRMNGEVDSKLELVFHAPSSIANVDSIMRNGLSADVRQSNPRGECLFTRRLATSLPYAEDRTVLVFLVVLANTSNMQDQGDVMAHSNVAFQLPVAKAVVS